VPQRRRSAVDPGRETPRIDQRERETDMQSLRKPGPEKNAGSAVLLWNGLLLLFKLPEYGENQKLYSAPSSAGNQCF